MYISTVGISTVDIKFLSNKSAMFKEGKQTEDGWEQDAEQNIKR